MFPLWPQWAGRAAGWRGSGQSLCLALVPPLSPLHVPLSRAQAAAVAGTGTPLAEGTPPSVHVCFYGHCCERTGVVLLLASRSRRAPSGRKPVGVAGQRSGSASWARQLVARAHVAKSLPWARSFRTVTAAHWALNKAPLGHLALCGRRGHGQGGRGDPAQVTQCQPQLPGREQRQASALDASSAPRQADPSAL